MADELGSGVRKLYRYVPYYSGKYPELIDGYVFRIIVPLDDNYSYDVEINKPQSQNLNRKICGLNEIAVFDYLKSNPTASQKEIAKAIGKSVRTVESAVALLKEKGLLIREGAKKNGRWIVK